MLGLQNIKMDRGTHLCWQLAMGGNSSSQKMRNCFFNRCRFSDGSKRHLSRAEWKFGGPLEGIRSVILLRLSWMNNINFLNCTLADGHEIGMFATNDNESGEIRFRNCTFFNALNEGFQGRVGLSRFELGYCYLLNCGFWAQGSSANPEDVEWDPGKWLIHHNIMDCRAQYNTKWRIAIQPQLIAFRHSADQIQPQKIYNNLLFWPPDQEEAAELGVQHLRNMNVTVTGIDKAHEVFNNIAIRHDIQRYSTAASNNHKEQTDFVLSFMNVSGQLSNEFWDYNLYYRDVPLVGGAFTSPFFVSTQEGRDTSPQDFTTLAAFKASGKFTLSKASGAKRGAYSAGFENNGTDTKPTLPSLDDFPNSRFQYRPAPRHRSRRRPRPACRARTGGLRRRPGAPTTSAGRRWRYTRAERLEGRARSRRLDHAGRSAEPVTPTEEHNFAVLAERVAALDRRMEDMRRSQERELALYRAQIEHKFAEVNQIREQINSERGHFVSGEKLEALADKIDKEFGELFPLKAQVAALWALGLTTASALIARIVFIIIG